MIPFKATTPVPMESERNQNVVLIRHDITEFREESFTEFQFFKDIICDLIPVALRTHDDLVIQRYNNTSDYQFGKPKCLDYIKQAKAIPFKKVLQYVGQEKFESNVCI